MYGCVGVQERVNCEGCDVLVVRVVPLKGDVRPAGAVGRYYRTLTTKNSADEPKYTLNYISIAIEIS